MIGRDRSANSALGRLAGALALVLALTVAALAGLTGSAGAATTTTTTIVYAPESQATLDGQLKAHEVEAIVVNKHLRSLRVTLKDGRHVLVKYPPHHEPETVAALKKAGVSVAILTPAQAKAEAPKKASHHKLRYIAGGILIVVIVVVVTVLLVDRRRKMRAE
ncbi:MAG TPA: hypothetical protein VL972_02605 [Solirubrobacteraceae bacterium]|nr:hypothetical protein [Solirubrobacteraceae bacterium]